MIKTTTTHAFKSQMKIHVAKRKETTTDIEKFMAFSIHKM